MTHKLYRGSQTQLHVVRPCMLSPASQGNCELADSAHSERIMKGLGIVFAHSVEDEEELRGLGCIYQAVDMALILDVESLRHSLWDTVELFFAAFGVPGCEACPGATAMICGWAERIAVRARAARIAWPLTGPTKAARMI